MKGLGHSDTGIATHDNRILRRRILCAELRIRISSIYDEIDACLLFACVGFIERSTTIR